jgi:hypothetical protein
MTINQLEIDYKINNQSMMMLVEVHTTQALKLLHCHRTSLVSDTTMLVDSLLKKHLYDLPKNSNYEYYYYNTFNKAIKMITERDKAHIKTFKCQLNSY